jgi:FlaA1/EpsC-like NDP-sugar epimerase
LRPGEKLHEELFYDREHVEQTASAKVLRALAPPPPDDLRDQVQLLLAMASGAHDESLRYALFAYIQETERAAAAHRPRIAHAASDIAFGLGRARHGDTASAAAR